MAIVNTSIAPLLKEGSNITLTQDGQVITIASTGGGGGGTPGGSDTQVQFNDGGSFGGGAGLTYDKTNNILDVESLDFATTPTAAAATYRLNTDDAEGSLNLGLKGGNVNIAVGAEVVIMSYNAEATTLSKGEVVYLYGAQGQRPSVKRADNTSDATSATTFGMVAESIASGGEGFVIQIGVLRNINTNAYNEGDILYLGTSGGVTTTKQYAPNHNVFVGVVLKKNATSGRIFVKPQNGYELDEIHNVSAQSPSDKDIIAYNTSTSLWEKKQLSAIGGVTGTGTSGQVAYWTGTTTQTGSNNLFWDNTNARLGIGTNAPTVTLDTRGLSSFTGTTATDGGQLGSELLSTANWTLGSGWTGDFTAGFAHSSGTVTLTNTLAAVNGNYYLIAYTVTGRTLGSFTIAFGGTTTSGITATGSTGPRATSTGTLVITPTTDFNGTIVFSIKVISASSASISLRNSAGTVTNEIRNSTSNTTTIIGINAGSRNLGISNTFLGDRAGSNNTTARNNSFFGSGSGATNIIGDGNAFFGWNAGLSNSTGANNSFFGSSVGQNTTSGSSNSFFGSSAGANNTTGGSNSFFGITSANGNTTGGFNCAFGINSGASNTTGSSNIFIGASAGRFISSGSNLTISNNSIFIGRDTRANADSETSQIVIGDIAIGLGSNTTVIGNSSTTYGRWWGNLLVGTSTNAGYALDVNGTARVQSSPSINSDSTLTISSTTNNSTASATLYGISHSSTISTINSTSAFVGINSSNNSSSNVSSVISFNGNVNVSAGTATTARVFHSNSAVTSAGTITNHIGYDYTDVFKSGSGSLGRQFAFRIANLANGTTANVGLLFNDSVSTSVNGNWDIYAQSGKSSYLAGDLYLGTNSTSATKLTVAGSETASSAIARGELINTTLVASANNDILVGLDINPTFTNGAFTGVSNLALRISNGNLSIVDKDIVLSTTTGTKIGTASSQKLSFWNAAPIVQPTTAVAAATLVGGGGTTITDTDTFDGYTLKQIVKALRNTGILA